MNAKIKKVISAMELMRNLFSLLIIALYLGYVIYNMQVNRGNFNINIALLIVTAVYFVAFIITAFVLKNKRAKKESKKAFKRVKKLLGLANAVLILVSVGTNDINNLATILLAVGSIIGTIAYFIFDTLRNIFVRKAKAYIKDTKNIISHGKQEVIDENEMGEIENIEEA